jgi:hypothetical protein
MQTGAPLQTAGEELELEPPTMPEELELLREPW